MIYRSKRETCGNFTATSNFEFDDISFELSARGKFEFQRGGSDSPDVADIWIEPESFEILAGEDYTYFEFIKIRHYIKENENHIIDTLIKSFHDNR